MVNLLQHLVRHLGRRSVLEGATPIRRPLGVQVLQDHFPIPLAPHTDGHARSPHLLDDGGIDFTGATPVAKSGLVARSSSALRVNWRGPGVDEPRRH